MTVAPPRRRGAARRLADIRADLCDTADAIALEQFRRDLVIETKPDRTFVTQADTAIERTIRA